MAPKYLHFLLPMFYLLCIFFPLEVAEKDLTVKRLVTGRRVGYHSSPPVSSAVVIYSPIATTGASTWAVLSADIFPASSTRQGGTAPKRDPNVEQEVLVTCSTY